jgi:hypothetical protein
MQNFFILFIFILSFNVFGQGYDDNHPDYGKGEMEHLNEWLGNNNSNDYGLMAKWTNKGHCFYFRGNTAIKPTHYDHCRSQEGSFYQKSNSGKCAEYTPRGQWIRYIKAENRYLCQWDYQGDGIIRWDVNGTCALFEKKKSSQKYDKVKSAPLYLCKKSEGSFFAKGKRTKRCGEWTEEGMNVYRGTFIRYVNSSKCQ